MQSNSLPLLWANCVERLKDRVNNRSFWEAIEQTQPIALENDTLIIGLDSTNFNQAAHIQHSSFQNTVARTIAEVFSQPLKLRVIEGVTPADWEAVKERDRRVAAMRQTVTQRAIQTEEQAHSWDGLYDSIAKMYALMPNRSLPQGKARYANEALYMLVETMDTLYSDPADELAERSLARILDRIASASEIPAPVLAFEMERLRAWRKAEAETGDLSAEEG